LLNYYSRNNNNRRRDDYPQPRHLAKAIGLSLLAYLAWVSGLLTNARSLSLAMAPWFIGNHYLPGPLIGLIPAAWILICHRLRTIATTRDTSEDNYIVTPIRVLASVNFWMVGAAVAFAVTGAILIRFSSPPVFSAPLGGFIAGKPASPVEMAFCYP
jgi:hypothetical protein